MNRYSHKIACSPNLAIFAAFDSDLIFGMIGLLGDAFSSASTDEEGARDGDGDEGVAEETEAEGEEEGEEGEVIFRLAAFGVWT